MFNVGTYTILPVYEDFGSALMDLMKFYKRRKGGKAGWIQYDRIIRNIQVFLQL